MARVVPRSVRGRAVVGTAVAMTLFGLVIGTASYVLVSSAARSSAQEVLSVRLNDVVEQLSDQGLGGPDALDLGITGTANPVFVQVVDATGAVVAATPHLDATERLCPDPVPSEPGHDTLNSTVSGHTGQFMRSTRTVTTVEGTLAVCAVMSTESIARAQSAVLLSLVLVLPLVIAAVCLAVWFAVGRALGAVDDLRRQAESLERDGGGDDEGGVRLVVQPTGDEVENLGVTLNRLLDHLHQQSRSTRQFVADAGHELRNPLATLRVSLEFAGDASEDELRTSMADSLADVDRLEELVQDLLALARSDSRESAALADTVELGSLVDSAVEAVNRRRPDVEVVASVAPCSIRGDGSGLQSMVSNLIDNASRHAQGRIDVRLEEVGETITLTVDDDGAGLDPEDCTRVFDRFVRLDDARVRDEGGSGLGLAIVASVAAAHGGQASALPRPGGHFVVTLPRTT